MQDFNAMPSQRRRLIGSSMPLNLEILSSDAYKLQYKSPRRVISEDCVKQNAIDVTQVDNFLILNSFNHIKRATEPTFTVTSTALRAGPDCANMIPLSTDILLEFMHVDADDFDFGELAQRQILKYGAQCIPTSFADKILLGVVNIMGPEDRSIFFGGDGPLGLHHRVVVDAAMVHFQGTWRPGRVAEKDKDGTLFYMAHDMTTCWFKNEDVVPIDRRVGTGYATLELLESAATAFAAAQYVTGQKAGIMSLQTPSMHPEWQKDHPKHCKWSRAFIHTEPGVEPGRRAIDKAGDPCEIVELVSSGQGRRYRGRVHYPRTDMFKCLKLDDLRPYSIGDSSEVCVVSDQTQVARPTEFRLPSSGVEMPVRSPEDWQSQAFVNDEILVNDLDKCIRDIAADSTLVGQLRNSSYPWESENGGFAFMGGISPQTLVYALTSHPLYCALWRTLRKTVVGLNKGRAAGELLTNYRVTVGVQHDSEKWYTSRGDKGTAYSISGGVQVGARLCMNDPCR